MVFVDNALADVATKFGANSFYLGFSTDTSLEDDPTATSLDGEIGTRVACTVSVIDNRVSIAGVRASTMVVNTASGDTLTGIGLFDSSTGGELFTITTIPNLLHTINFDFNIEAPIDFERS